MYITFYTTMETPTHTAYTKSISEGCDCQVHKGIADGDMCVRPGKLFDITETSHRDGTLPCPVSVMQWLA